MGDDIFIGDLEKEITLLDGVVSLIDLRVYKLWNGTYSVDKCPLPPCIESDGCNVSSSPTLSGIGDDVKQEQIDLSAVDRVLYGDYNSMYEIKNPSFDIQVKCKTR